MLAVCCAVSVPHSLHSVFSLLAGLHIMHVRSPRGAGSGHRCAGAHEAALTIASACCTQLVIKGVPKAEAKANKARRVRVLQQLCYDDGDGMAVAHQRDTYQSLRDLEEQGEADVARAAHKARELLREKAAVNLTNLAAVRLCRAV